MNTPVAETRHLPVPDAETRPYWDAAAEGRLLLPWCNTCNRAYFYPRAHCPNCYSADTAWVDSPGRGVVHAFTIVRQNGARPFRERLPYVLVLVELDEGVRILSCLEDVDPEGVFVGQAVEVHFRLESDDAVLPIFRAAASS